MEDPRKLRELAGWNREFAERTGNPDIWHRRLLTAEKLEQEADRLEKMAARSHAPLRNGPLSKTEDQSNGGPSNSCCSGREAPKPQRY